MPPKPIAPTASVNHMLIFLRPANSVFMLAFAWTGILGTKKPTAIKVKKAIVAENSKPALQPKF
ncbi:hypothetical protein D3C76_1493420 [compost metagenome]